MPTVKPINWGDKRDKRWEEWTKFRGTIFLCGHGTYAKEKGGFVKVPKGTTVTLHGAFGWAIDQWVKVLPILKGKASEPDRVCKEFMSCPDLTLSPDEEKYLEPSEKAIKENTEAQPCRILNVNSFHKDGWDADSADESQHPRLTLSEILAAFPGNHFVWACCQSLTKTKAPTQNRAPAAPAADPKLAQKQKEIREREAKDMHFVSTVPDDKELKALKLDAKFKQAIEDAVEYSEGFIDTLDSFPNWKQRLGYQVGSRNLGTAEQANNKLAAEANARTDLNADPRLTLLRQLLKLDEAKIDEAAKLPALQRYSGLASFKRKKLEELISIMTPEILEKAIKIARDEAHDKASAKVLEAAKKAS